jgi:hypothetical protein
LLKLAYGFFLLGLILPMLIVDKKLIKVVNAAVISLLSEARPYRLFCEAFEGSYFVSAT